MCLIGNVDPLEIAARGTPDEVREATLEVLEGGTGEDGRGMILSRRRDPGMPRENAPRCSRPSRNSMPSSPGEYMTLPPAGDR